MSAASEEDKNFHLSKAFELQADRKLMMDTMKKILAAFPQEYITTDHLTTNALTPAMLENCFYPLVKEFSSKCFNVGCNNYGYRVVRYFTDLCINQVPVDKVIYQMSNVCDKSVQETKCGIE